MIRVIIALIGIFIIWVLFFSKFSKQSKIALVAGAIILSMTGFWFESSAGKSRSGIVQVDQIVSCGISAQHSYRTNFDISLCIRNNAETGNVTRLGLYIIAEQCVSSESCVELQGVERDIAVDVPAQSSVKLLQNLSFTKLDANSNQVRWSFKVRSVQASK